MEKLNSETVGASAFFLLSFLLSGVAFAAAESAVSLVSRSGQMVTGFAPAMAEAVLWMCGIFRLSRRAITVKCILVIVSASLAALLYSVVFPRDARLDPVGANPYVQMFFGAILGVVQAAIWGVLVFLRLKIHGLLHGK